MDLKPEEEGRKKRKYLESQTSNQVTHDFFPTFERSLPSFRPSPSSSLSKSAFLPLQIFLKIQSRQQVFQVEKVMRI